MLDLLLGHLFLYAIWIHSDNKWHHMHISLPMPYVHICACVCMQGWVQRPEVNQLSSSMALHLILWGRLWICSLPFSWTAGQQAPTIPPSTQIASTHPAPSVYVVVLGTEPISSGFSLAWDTHCSEALEELFTVIDLGAWITTLLKTMDVLQTWGMGITYPPPAPVTWQGFKISKEPYTRP